MPKRAPKIPRPEEAAEIAVSRWTKPLGRARAREADTTLLPRELAERLSAQAIRERKNLEAVVIEILGQARST